MRAFAVGEIIESRNPRYSTGEKVMGLFGWQEYAAATDKHVNLKIAPRDLPLSLHLGVLEINRFTAYFGLLDVGLPKAEIPSVFRPRQVPSGPAWGRSPKSRVAAR